MSLSSPFRNGSGTANSGEVHPHLLRPGLRTTAKSSRRPELSPNQEKR